MALPTMISDLFNHTFKIERVQEFDDGQGGTIREYAELGQVRGYLNSENVRPTERRIALQEAARQLWTLFCLPTETDLGTTIKRGDRISVADGPPELTVYAISVRNPGLMNHHLEILCEERQDGESGTI